MLLDQELVGSEVIQESIEVGGKLRKMLRIVEETTEEAVKLLRREVAEKHLDGIRWDLVLPQDLQDVSYEGLLVHFLLFGASVCRTRSGDNQR